RARDRHARPPGREWRRASRDAEDPARCGEWTALRRRGRSRLRAGAQRPALRRRTRGNGSAPAARRAHAQGRRRDRRPAIDRAPCGAILRAQARHRARPSDGSDRACDHHPRQHRHWRPDHIDHERALEHHGVGAMTAFANRLAPHRLRSLAAAASPGYTPAAILVVLTIISLLLGLVGPRVLNYLGESRVKTAKLQIESFSSALDLFYLDAGRYPTSSEGL